jgi:hypothetical protein
LKTIIARSWWGPVFKDKVFCILFNEVRQYFKIITRFSRMISNFTVFLVFLFKLNTIRVKKKIGANREKRQFQGCH